MDYEQGEFTYGRIKRARDVPDGGTNSDFGYAVRKERIAIAIWSGQEKDRAVEDGQSIHRLPRILYIIS
jgi:hypothetical protein